MSNSQECSPETFMHLHIQPFRGKKMPLYAEEASLHLLGVLVNYEIQGLKSLDMNTAQRVVGKPLPANPYQTSDISYCNYFMHALADQGKEGLKSIIIDQIMDTDFHPGENRTLFQGDKSERADDLWDTIILQDKNNRNRNDNVLWSKDKILLKINMLDYIINAVNFVDLANTIQNNPPHDGYQVMLSTQQCRLAQNTNFWVKKDQENRMSFTYLETTRDSLTTPHKIQYDGPGKPKTFIV